MRLLVSSKTSNKVSLQVAEEVVELAGVTTAVEAIGGEVAEGLVEEGEGEAGAERSLADSRFADNGLRNSV